MDVDGNKTEFVKSKKNFSEGMFLYATGVKNTAPKHKRHKNQPQDAYRLMNIMFSPGFVQHVPTLGHSSTRTELDTPGGVNRQNFWENVSSTFCDEQLGTTSHINKLNFTTKSPTIKGIADKLLMTVVNKKHYWKTLKDLWTYTCNKFNRYYKKYDVSGNHTDLETTEGSKHFVNFCNGEVTPLYLYYYTERHADVLNYIKADFEHGMESIDDLDDDMLSRSSPSKKQRRDDTFMQALESLSQSRDRSESTI